MAVVARGKVAGQAFARTVYAIARKRFTGDFALTEHGQEYRVTWRDGTVVGADSKAPADSPARVALTAGLLTTTQVAEVLRHCAHSPERDPVLVITQLARLSDRQHLALARRALLQKAIRVFALPEATFELHDQAGPTAGPDIAPIGVRTLIFRGLLAHYDEPRLEREMAAAAGARFTLTKDENVRRRLAEYGFAEVHVACVRKLAAESMTLAALREALPRTSRKDILLALYALLSTDDIKARRAKGADQPTATVSIPSAVPPPVGPDEPRAPRATPEPDAQPASPKPRARRRATTLPPHLSDGVPRPPSSEAERRQVDESRPINISSLSVERARIAARAPSRTLNRPVDRTRANEIRELIATRAKAMDEGGDYYALLDVPHNTDEAGLRRAYFDLAKKLHPDRLRALAIDDEDGHAQRLFATVNKAFAVLGKPEERARYDTALERGGTGDKAQDRLRAEKQAMKLFSAEEHFLRGELALRGNRFDDALAEFDKAVELNPDEAEHHALRAWANWCAASDKEAALVTVRQGLARALHLSPKCVPAYFYRGQLHSALGQQSRALEDFRKVLKLQPSHREAELQVRLLKSRMERSGNKRGRKKSR